MKDDFDSTPIIRIGKLLSKGKACGKYFPAVGKMLVDIGFRRQHAMRHVFVHMDDKDRFIFSNASFYCNNGRCTDEELFSESNFFGMTVRPTNFQEVSDFLKRIHPKYALRLVLSYLALIKHWFDDFPVESRRVLLGMIQLFIDAYNLMQLQNSGRATACAVRLQNSQVLPVPFSVGKKANDELCRVSERFDGDSATSSFCGNLMSSKEVGTVYCFKKGRAFSADVYRECQFFHHDDHDDHDETPSNPRLPDSVFVNRSPIGVFASQKKYRVVEWTERLGSRYARIEDDRGQIVCIKENRVAGVFS